MDASKWFASASAEGAFAGREERKVEVSQPAASFGPTVVDRWDATNRKWLKIWSDTGLPYNEKSWGGR